MTTVYKVVRQPSSLSSDLIGEPKSANIDLPQKYVVRYSATRKSVGVGASLLFAFDSLENANRWLKPDDYELDIWEAEAEVVEGPPGMGTPIGTKENTFSEFWRNWRMSRGGLLFDDTMFSLIRGTIFCEWIQLVRRVE